MKLNSLFVYDHQYFFICDFPIYIRYSFFSTGIFILYWFLEAAYVNNINIAVPVRDFSPAYFVLGFCFWCFLTVRGILLSLFSFDFVSGVFWTVEIYTMRNIHIYLDDLHCWCDV